MSLISGNSVELTELEMTTRNEPSVQAILYIPTSVEGTKNPRTMMSM
jgi:hypothetical protein